MSASDLSARSWLFAPGDSPRKIEKASASGADLVLLDLEDAVTESAKPAARGLVASHLRARSGGPQVWVRINPLDTTHALKDLAAIVAAAPDGIMLPKATRTELDILHHYLSALEAASGVDLGAIRVIVVATETPAALFGLGDYGGAPRLAALTWGARMNGDWALMPPVWLLLYGAGALAGGVFTVAAVRLLGLAFMALGVLALVTPPAWGDVWLGMGFGGLQIGFGLYIARRHGG